MIDLWLKKYSHEECEVSYALLIEAEDAILGLDDLLIELTGFGHFEGKLQNLDNVYEVIRNNSNDYYKQGEQNQDSDGSADKRYQRV